MNNFAYEECELQLKYFFRFNVLVVKILIILLLLSNNSFYEQQFTNLRVNIDTCFSLRHVGL